MEKQTFNKKLAKQITKLRLERNLTHTQLAKLSGKNQKQVIQRLETGTITPSAYFVYKLSKALNVPIGELINF
jgi:transcriptional regulator with XRE-family HTH domain